MLVIQLGFLHSCLYADSFLFGSLILYVKQRTKHKFFCLSFSGILDDTYALCEACQVSVSSLLSLMNVYRKELDYTVLSRLIEVHVYFPLNRIHNELAET